MRRRAAPRPLLGRRRSGARCSLGGRAVRRRAALRRRRGARRARRRRGRGSCSGARGLSVTRWSALAGRSRTSRCRSDQRPRGRLTLPPGRDRGSAAPRAGAAGPAGTAHACASTRASPGAGAQQLAPPRVVRARPARAGRAPVARRGGPDEVLVLPRIEPVRGAAPAGRRRIAAPARAPVAAEVELDGLRPRVRARRRRGSTGRRWPRGARADGAPAARRGRHAPARRARPARRRARRRSSTRRCARRPRCACTWPAPGGCALLLPGDGGPRSLEPDLGGWPHAHARLALVEARRRRRSPGCAARRGPVIYVAARRVDPLAAGARPTRRAAARARRPRRARGPPRGFTVAGCHGYELSGTRAAPAGSVLA